MSTEDEDICGLCGQPGADKIAHQVYWPGEQRPTGQLVHAQCEDEECRRAHQEFMSKNGEDAVLDFLRSIK